MKAHRLRGTFAQRMQMVADDGRRQFEDGQKIIANISRTMPNGWPKGEQLRDEALRICARRYLRGLFPSAIKNNKGSGSHGTTTTRA